MMEAERRSWSEREQKNEEAESIAQITKNWRVQSKMRNKWDKRRSYQQQSVLGVPEKAKALDERRIKTVWGSHGDEHDNHCIKFILIWELKADPSANWSNMWFSVNLEASMISKKLGPGCNMVAEAPFLENGGTLQTHHFFLRTNVQEFGCPIQPGKPRGMQPNTFCDYMLDRVQSGRLET